MKKATARVPGRVELGRCIVADPEICHGKPTFKGTRIMVWQVLDELAHGMTSDAIEAAWGGRVSRSAIAESVRLARLSLFDGDAAKSIRRFLRHPRFNSLAKRTGVVVRVHHDGIEFWQRNSPTSQHVGWDRG